MTMPTAEDPAALLQRSLESGRIHSAYLISGPGSEPRDAALAFVRGLVCRAAASDAAETPAARASDAAEAPAARASDAAEAPAARASDAAEAPAARASDVAEGPSARPCGACSDCQRSAEREAIALDGAGRKGPLLRHVGDHPDLVWVERGSNDTRVRIAQVRALQHELGLRAWGPGRRAAVIADAEWLNLEAQNALLRLLEEPPAQTTIVLVAATAAGLLATLRSRCQRVAFRPPEQDPLALPERRDLVARLDELPRAGVPEILDWAERYRGARSDAAQGVHELLDTAMAWIGRRVAGAVREPGRDLRRELDAGRVLSEGRKQLDQRNANPQMVAERVLLALREAIAG